MANKIDFSTFSGRKFARLTALSPAPGASLNTSWFFRCECGAKKAMRVSVVVSGVGKSCGCLRDELARVAMAKQKYSKTHGMTRTPTYRTWRAMLRRCSREAMPRDISAYYGKGIRVCDRWHDFSAFLADMGIRPDGMTIDRIDAAKGYSPDNCRWASAKEQARNTTRTKLFTVDGVSKTLMGWSESTGINHHCLYYRVNKLGLSICCALSMPNAQGKTKGNQRASQYRCSRHPKRIVAHGAGEHSKEAAQDSGRFPGVVDRETENDKT